MISWKEDKINKNFRLAKKCAKHARRFIKAVVKAESPMELAELFHENIYLRKDMDGNANLFNYALDYFRF